MIIDDKDEVAKLVGIAKILYILQRNAYISQFFNVMAFVQFRKSFPTMTFFHVVCLFSQKQPPYLVEAMI